MSVCAWAWVSAAPHHSWLGCWGVCVLVCAFCWYPATPGWGARCGWVCLGPGFGCAPPPLAGVLGCARARSACTPPLLAGVCCVGACAWARVWAVPRLSWLGCSGARVRALLVPRHSWLGCWGLRVCVPARVSAAPRHPWLGCWGVGVLLCALRLYPATPGWGVRCGCVCLGSGVGCAPPLLAGVLGSACLCARSACTPPLLAGVCGVGRCAWAWVSAAPRHSWLGRWGVCVFVCALPLYPATPGWGLRCGCVCFGSGFGCAPPLLAGLLGCACLCARSAFTCHPWLGCAACVCVLGLRFRLRRATPGWAVGVCVCCCARSTCTLPLLAGVRGAGVCVWARVSAAPRRSWLGCWGVCVLGCALRFYPATPGWGVRRGCACLGSGYGCAPPLLAGVLGCVCFGVRAPLVPRHS